MPRECFVDVSECFERNPEESIRVRNELLGTFRQLGPPDLVHVVKTTGPNSRHQVKEASSYHFILGVDTSSSASIAAYINSLTYSLPIGTSWFAAMGGTGAANANGGSWNLSKCTYSAFNAFRGLDVRVEARIPGGVKSYTIDALGQRSTCTTEIWQEVFLSSLLRYIFFRASGNGGGSAMKSIRGVLRRYTGSMDKAIASKSTASGSAANPAVAAYDSPSETLLFNPQMEMKFLEIAARLFHRGHVLGNQNGVATTDDGESSNSPSCSDNFLVQGLVEYFCSTGRPEIVIGFFKGLSSAGQSATECAGHLIRCYLEANHQELAVDIISNHNAINSSSSAFGATSDFLANREDYGRAELCAREALKRDPLSFSNWTRLARLQIILNDLRGALVTLNNAPNNDAFLLSVRSNNDFTRNLPAPAAISIVSKDSTPADEDSEFTLFSTTAAATSSQTSSLSKVLEGLKGAQIIEDSSSDEAYQLLVLAHQKFGWEQLLATRSQVFLMAKDGNDIHQGLKDSGAGVLDTLDEHPHEKDSQHQSSVVETKTSITAHQKSAKKLCERWLDNLILILFEDLRVFSLFSEELESNSNTIFAGRSSREWLLLGLLSIRLKEQEAAKFALQRASLQSEGKDHQKGLQCLALRHFFHIHCSQGRLALALLTANRLAELNPIDFLHPSKLVTEFVRLIKRFGLQRIQQELESCNEATPTGVLGGNCIKRILYLAKESKVHGFDY